MTFCSKVRDTALSGNEYPATERTRFTSGRDLLRREFASLWFSTLVRNKKSTDRVFVCVCDINRTMGFIIHKYFLSKNLKAPAPSDGKKKKSKTSRRHSQPDLGAYSDHLTIPEHAYATSSNSVMNSPGTTSRRRRSSLTHAPSSSSSYRRSSMPTSTSSSEEQFYDTAGRVDELDTSYGNHRPSRRSSMSSQQVGEKVDPHRLPETEDPYAVYYNIALDSKEDLPHFEETVTPHRRYPRRTSASSLGSRSESSGSGSGSDSSYGGTGTGTRQTRPGHSSNTKKHLRMQLDQSLKHSAMLEAQLYRTRDQLAVTHASWLGRFQDAQHKHQEEVFQAQRQAEKASNALLEQEFDALKSAMDLLVAQEEAASKLKKEKEKKTEKDKKKTEKDSRYKVYGEGKEDHDVVHLLNGIEEWKRRYEEATTNSKLVQDLLEQENTDIDALLKENQRRVTHLERELEVAVLGDIAKVKAGQSAPIPISPQLVGLLKSHQYELEERVDELLMENANLQQSQSEMYTLQGQVKKLHQTLKEMKEQMNDDKTRYNQEVEQCRQEVQSWQTKAGTYQRNLSQQITSREVIRGEYVHRIEDVEAENVRLTERFNRKQEEWEHRMNLKDRTIENLRSQLIQDDRDNHESQVSAESKERVDHDELLRRMRRLAASEAQAQQELQIAQKKIAGLTQYLNQVHPNGSPLDVSKIILEFDAEASFSQSTLNDDSSIHELLDKL